MVLHNRKNLKGKRNQLRSSLTPAEAELWKYLKNSQLQGRKFRRQHSIGNYIVDFYCPSERLVIELDGKVHYNTITEPVDQERDQALNKLGIKVLRFENKFIFQSLEAVLLEIENSFEEPDTTPLLRQGGAGGLDPGKQQTKVPHQFSPNKKPHKLLHLQGFPNLESHF